MTRVASTAKTRGKLAVDLAILAAGIGWLVFLLSLSPPPEQNYTYLDVERVASSALKHGHLKGDLTQDIIGCRAIFKNQDAYPMLGPAMEKLGIQADIKHVSTHPPTAFLLVSPIAWMPVNQGSRAWAWMMVACLAASFFCLGCGVIQAMGLAFLSLAWTPAAFCLDQLTAIWLLGVCAAYRCLSNSPAISGAMLGLASATKMAPAILLLLLLRNRKALVGFALFVVALLVMLLYWNPSSITAYRQVVKHAVPWESGRPDNGSIVGQVNHHFGKAGLLAVTVFLGAVLFANWRETIRGSLTGWTTLSYLAVAILPIMWVYSLVPLLFLGRWAWLGGRPPKLFFFSFILLTAVGHIWDSPKVLAASVAWVGIGLLVVGLITPVDQANPSGT